MIGDWLGSYQILQKIGSGGMGEVYLAQHPLIGRRVAIKMLLPEYSSDPDTLARFFNEARATTQIRHPGIVDILDFGMHPSGGAYIIMEMLGGETLAATLKRLVRLPVEGVIGLARQIAQAVGAAHAHHVIHRDLKPDNVFLVPDPTSPLGLQVKVLDFGIAKLASDAGANVKTKTGTMMGTPLYMSPEQCSGKGQVDARTDIYALGCMMYEMACGRPPFLGRTLFEVITAQLTQKPQPPRVFTPTLPGDLEVVIMRALAKNPAQRPQSMSELVGELDRISGGRYATVHGMTQASVSTLVEPVATGSVPALSPPALATTIGRHKPAPVKQSRAWIWLLVLLVLAGGGAAAWWFWLRG
jgi:serine/threonine-protein kinase